MASLNSNTRTDVQGVKEIFDTDLSDDAIKVHAQINAAAEEVDDIASTDSVSGQRLELIERYLAAHFASTQDPRVSDASVGDSNVSYGDQRDAATYFATASSLDPTGTLSDEGTVQASVLVPNARSLDTDSDAEDRY
jgi:hypothetical protein